MRGARQAPAGPTTCIRPVDNTIAVGVDRLEDLAHALLVKHSHEDRLLRRVDEVPNQIVRAAAGDILLRRHRDSGRGTGQRT